jgi:PAS domain S-box-containing protein
VEARRTAIWPALAVAAQVAIAVVDAALGDDLVLTGVYVIPVLALALVARTREVLVVAGLGVALAVVSGVWNDYVATADHFVRVAVVACAGALAVFSARTRLAAEEERARMSLLAEVSRITDAPTLDAALERLGDVTVPAAARACWVDLTEPDGSRRRAFTRGNPDGGDTVTLPLRIRDRDVGELGFAADEYDDADRSFLAVLSGRVALVLGNARLLAELSRTHERLDRILGSLAEAVTVHDAQGQTVYANDAARELLGLDADEPLPARAGSIAARFIITHEDGTPVDVDEFPGRRLVAGEDDPPPLLTRSVRRDTGREYWLLTKASLLHDDDGGPMAVNVIEDVTDAKEADLRQRFLDQAGQVLAASLDYELALQRVAELAVPWLADWCAVDLTGEHGVERVAVAHADRSKLALAEELSRRYPPDPAAESGVPAVLRTGRAEHYPQVADELIVQAAIDDEHLRLIREIGMRAVMILPMAAGDEVLGALTLVSAESARTFDDDDFAFAQDLARRAATAVQNGRLYAEQVRVAETLQRSLLPARLPDVPGWQASACYEAGDERAQVGGDFYDVVPTAGGHLVILGDVTGKGVEAAALTALVRHSAQMAARFDHRPGALLRLVNDVLREQQQVAPVSVVCALIEQGERAPCVTVAAAGHPLPLLKGAGGSPREVGTHDILLGVVDHGEFAEVTVEVEVGDVLLFYTDGVIDAPGGEGRFGEARLHEAVAAAPAEPGALLDALEAALRDFVSAGGADDRAMLALRYTGPRVNSGAGSGLPLEGAPA